MAPTDENLPSASDIERFDPCAAARPAAPAQPTVSDRKPPTAASEIGWGLVSTAILAAWLGWQWGWVFAAAGVLGVLVHELGHLAAINSLGCGPGRIHVIPFFGGAASMARAPDTEFKGVLIALAGPVAGLAATAPFYLLYANGGDRIWLQGVLFIGGMNLLNLAPVPPLDGAKALGPALAWLHPNVERAVMILLGGIGVYWAVSHGQFLIAVVIGLSLAQALRGRAFRVPALRLTALQWAVSMGLWVGAVVLCGSVTWSALAPNT
ncbi:MAG: hypothetical protein P4L64_08720 [Caulobacteraceae bacterium]|nr:hypothetical protein [Caulobacteraceae bacterium]